LICAPFRLYFLFWHHGDISEANGWRVLLSAFVVNEPPNHDGVVTNPNILVGDKLRTHKLI
jgi:hypothetical protein